MKVWGISNEVTQSTLIMEHAIGNGRVTSCTWSPNGEWIAFCQITHTSKANETNKPHATCFIFHIWNAHTMTEHHRFTHETGSTYREQGHMGFSPDSRWLAWFMWHEGDPHYSIWNVGADPNEPPRRVPAQPDSALGQFESVSFDPQSKRTFSTHSYLPNGEKDNSVRIWDNETGELLVAMAGHLDKVTYATFSSDGRHILSASMDRTAKVWDAESGSCLLSLNGHEVGVTRAIFSPDGRYIAIASDMDVQLFSGDGVRLATFAEHTARVTHLAFSPDGRTLASGDCDGIVHIRDIGGLVQH